MDSQPLSFLSHYIFNISKYLRKERDNSSTMAKIYGILRAWKEHLHPRRIDLVGDYAGRELFIVEGDSLLRQALSDERIDIEGI